MKITYAQNPLATRIELNDQDRKLIRTCLEIDDLEDRIFMTSRSLDIDSDTFNLIEARKRSDTSFMDGEAFEIREAGFTELVKFYEAELLSVHYGDCTCFAASCAKCYAEQFLGIDTLGKAGKHMLYEIQRTFKNPKIKTCAQAIKHLKGLKLTPTIGLVIQYLETYKLTHLKGSK